MTYHFKKQGTMQNKKYNPSTKEILTRIKKSGITSSKAVSGTHRRPLVEKESFSKQLSRWAIPVSIFLSITFLIFFINAALDFDWEQSENGFFYTTLTTNPDHVNDALGSFIELLAANLGIMITVVAIVLQLAAQRYGTRLIDLFLDDKINRAYFVFMVSNLLFSIILIFTLKTDFFPFYAIEILLFFTLIEIALLAPYFMYIFQFLTPTNLLSAIQTTSRESVNKAIFRNNYPHMQFYQKEAANSVDQVTDTALSANSQMDRNLGLMAIGQIREMVLDYLELKKKLPKIWFSAQQDFFVGISTEFYQEICNQKLWFEAKTFMDMELIYRTCIRDMPDAISAIALNTRIIGEAAIKYKDDFLLDMVVKFYNTFIRVSLNDLNQRAIFNLYYQYRLLAESIFDYDIELSKKIIFYFKDYGEIALKQKNLPFVMYNAAFDMGTMVAKAHDKKLSNMKEILLTFMEMEDKVDKQKDFFALMGIRKSQLILAAYLKSRGDKSLLPIIVEDLKQDTFSFLIQMRDSLLAVKDKKYWEITDRGYNFEYIDEEQKGYLIQFYEEYIISQKEAFK
jgi:hypothetical protein